MCERRPPEQSSTLVRRTREPHVQRALRAADPRGAAAARVRGLGRKRESGDEGAARHCFPGISRTSFAMWEERRVICFSMRPEVTEEQLRPSPECRARQVAKPRLKSKRGGGRVCCSGCPAAVNITGLWRRVDIYSS